MFENSILNVTVSCFAHAKATESRPVNLLSWLTSLKHQVMVERIRSVQDKVERSKLKEMLPAITPSGLFAQRGAKYLIEHSGLIAFDIDFAENKHITNYDELKNQLVNIQNVAYCGLSVSGTGYWGLIPITYADKHKQHFISLQANFKELGIVIDGACSDVCRLRYYSYDTDAYFNHQAIPFCHFCEPKPPAPLTYYCPGSNKPLEIAAKMIRESIDGEKHHALVKAAFYLGGCSINGLVDGQDAIDLLRKEIESKPNVRDLQAAFRTIEKCFAAGKTKPII